MVYAEPDINPEEVAIGALRQYKILDVYRKSKNPQRVKS